VPKALLGLGTVVFIKIPEDGTLVPKHVKLALNIILFYDLCFIVFYLRFCWFIYRTLQNVTVKMSVAQLCSRQLKGLNFGQVRLP
jgi:hypothetical protein